MTPFRHPAGRIQHRAPAGTFRESTLADIGMACCPCGFLFAPDLEACRVNGFVDRRAVREEF